MRLNASNNAESKLVHAIDETDTLITVEDTSTFPELPFLLTIFEDGVFVESEVNEIVKVTEVNGNELTVERGQEGTIAKWWEIGSKIENRFTAGMYDGLASEKDLTDHAEEKEIHGTYTDKGQDPEYQNVEYKLVVINGEPFLEVVAV